MNKKIAWLGGKQDKKLIAILEKQDYSIHFLADVKQCQVLQSDVDCLIYYAPSVELQIADIPADIPVVLYEPRSFTYYMLSGHNTRFVTMTKIAQQAAAVICCDEASRQWWSCFNVNTYLLGEAEKTTAPDAIEVRIAEMIVEDYLAGCSYAVRHRVGLWGKVKRYYKEFGLRQTLHRVYEKLSGQEDE